MKKVCMFVFNNFTNDSRVLKEAQSLIASGCEVTVVACLDSKTLPVEMKNGIQIYRLERQPIHQVLTQSVIQFLVRIRRAITSVKRLIWSIPRFVRRFVRLCFAWGRRILGAVGRRVGVEMRSEESDVVRQENKPESAMKAPDVSETRRRLSPIIFDFVRSSIRFIFKPVHLPFVYWDFYQRALELIKDKNFDVYHCHDLNTLLIGYLATKKYGGRFVYDSHELFLERNRAGEIKSFERWLLFQFEKYLIRRTSVSITVSHSIADELVKRYKVQRPEVIMNAPDGRGEINLADERWSLRRALEIPKNEKILLYTGVRTYNRGLEQVIAALPRINGCRFVMMGYGHAHYDEKLMALASGLGVESRISFFGPVPSGEVAYYAASADLGVAAIQNACLSYYYCSPNKVFEYIAAGLPVATSNFPDMERVVKEYEVGETFDPANVENIIEAISGLLKDENKYLRMKKNTPRAAQNFNWAVEEKKLLDLYNRISLA